MATSVIPCTNMAISESYQEVNNFAVVNCTGTVSGSLTYIRTKGGLITVSGRVRISSFVRTGSNPGVSFTLPECVTTPTVTHSFKIGFRGESPMETIALQKTKGSRAVTLITHESYSNAANGTLTLVIPNTSVIV